MTCPATKAIFNTSIPTFSQRFTVTEKCGFDLKSNEINIYEQKPINVDDFNEVEEKEVKNMQKNKNKKGERQPRKITCLKKKRKQEATKIKEKDMWKRLSQLNNEFKEIKKSNKDAKKMSDTIIKH